jgi:hypothetical protein
VAEPAETRGYGATLSLLARSGTAHRASSRKVRPPEPILAQGAILPGSAPAERPGQDRDGPHVPVLALILSVPVIVAVVLFCVVTRPGILVSLLAVVLTPIVVFAATLGAVMLRDRLRRHG